MPKVLSKWLNITSSNEQLYSNTPDHVFTYLCFNGMQQIHQRINLSKHQLQPFHQPTSRDPRPKGLFLWCCCDSNGLHERPCDAVFWATKHHTVGGLSWKQFEVDMNGTTKNQESNNKLHWFKELIEIIIVDGINQANQLRLVVYPIIYRVFYIPSGFFPDFWTINIHQQYHTGSSCRILWNHWWNTELVPPSLKHCKSKSPWEEKRPSQKERLASWWLNQSIWKICSSNWIISPIFGMKIENIWVATT